MLRPTSSPIIYMQQLGRALSVGHNSEPIVNKNLILPLLAFSNVSIIC